MATLYRTVRRVKGNYTATASDCVIEVTGGNATVTLPAASAVTSTNPITIKNANTGYAADDGTIATPYTITVARAGADTIDGGTSVATQGELTVYSDGSSKWVSTFAIEKFDTDQGLDAPVDLQSASPGTKQTGNVNVSGAVIAGPATGSTKLSGASGYGLVETVASGTDANLVIRSKGEGTIYFATTTKGDPTGYIILIPETSPVQSAIGTNGTAGLKVSNSTASGPIDIGAPGSGADVNRHGVRFTPDATGGPMIHPQTAAASADFIIAAKGTGTVKVRNNTNAADAPIEASKVYLGGQTVASPVILGVGAGIEFKKADESGYTTTYQSISTSTTYHAAPGFYWSSSGLYGYGYTSSALPPTTTEIPTNKGFAIHEDTNTGKIYFAYNKSGVIKMTELT